MSVGTDERRMMGLRIGVVGAGKMGISHLSIINAHPAVELVGVCDTTNYLLDVLHKYSELPTFTDYAEMIRPDLLDAVIIATPTKSHAPMIEWLLNAGVHVFCEKPLCLDPSDSRRFAAMADARGIVTQVGYHNRYVGAFAEVKRLLEAGAIGKVTHVLAEAYGPVVLAPKGRTWRSQSTRGAAASPTMPHTRSTFSRGISVSRTAWVAPRCRVRSLGDRRRGSVHDLLPGWSQRAVVGQLVRRFAAQDDDQDHPLGHGGSHLR